MASPPLERSCAETRKRSRLSSPGILISGSDGEEDRERPGGIMRHQTRRWKPRWPLLRQIVKEMLMKRLTVSLILALAPTVAAQPPVTNIPDLQAVLEKGFHVTTLDGQSVPLSDLVQNGKPVLVEFWATWCSPCRKTLPHLVELQKRHGSDLVIIGLTVEDPSKAMNKVRDFAEEHGINFRVAFAPDELFSFMNHRPDVAVPKLFVYDQDGQLSTYIPRYSPFTARRMRGAVRNVLSRE